jgi:hypothetical protein
MTSPGVHLSRMLTSRGALLLFNAIFIYFTALSLWGAIRPFRFGHPDAHELEAIIDGIAVLSIAFGVALECRKDIMAMLGLYPALKNATERRIDQVCHDFGIWYLLLGLLMDIPVQAVKVPEHIFATTGIEVPTLLVAVFFLAVALLAGLRASWLLLRLPPLREDG